MALLLVLGALLIAPMVSFRFVRRLPQAREAENGPDPSEVAGRPIVWTQDSLTEAALYRRQKEFALRHYQALYDRYGPHQRPWDPEARQLFRAWILELANEPPPANLRSPQELADRLAARPDCDDPLVLTVAAANSIELHEATKRLQRALAAYKPSPYPAYPRFYATVMLGNNLRENGRRVASLDASAVEWFGRAFEDGSLEPGDQAELADRLVEGWGRGFFGANARALGRRAAHAGRPFQWLALVLEGEAESGEAWAARGGGYANTVTAAGWEGFYKHLARARKAFTRAWQLEPRLSLAPTRMIDIAMADSDLAEMRLWFDRVTVLQLDDATAWGAMRWGLRPRWHGTPEAMLAFGASALNTKRFDTDVPRQLFLVINDLEAELATAPGQHLYGREDLWPSVREMYEGYLAAPSRTNETDGWHSTYATVAYLAGKYDVARRQLAAVHWEPGAWNLAGWGRDLSLMSLEVAARTGAWSNQIADAENASRDLGAREGLRRYTALASAAGADPRTQRFIHHRQAALEVERRLRAGGWVDFLPAQADDPNWITLVGHAKRLADGGLEVTSGRDGHMLYSRVPVGPNLEVKGEFEVEHSSDKSFQAGLVLGLPSLSANSWYSFRMKQNPTDGEAVSFARNWTTPQLFRLRALDAKRNSFDLRLQDGRVTAAVDGVVVFREAKPPRTIAVAATDFLVGLGAFNDMNTTAICYRHLQVRRLPSAAAADPGSAR